MNHMNRTLALLLALTMLIATGSAITPAEPPTKLLVGGTSSLTLGLSGVQEPPEQLEQPEPPEPGNGLGSTGGAARLIYKASGARLTNLPVGGAMSGGSAAMTEIYATATNLADCTISLTTPPRRYCL